MFGCSSAWWTSYSIWALWGRLSACGLAFSGSSRLKGGLQPEMAAPLSRIRMAAQGRQRPVDLFRQYDSREFMGHRHRRKRRQQVRLFTPSRRQAVGPADDEQQVTSF